MLIKRLRYLTWCVLAAYTYVMYRQNIIDTKYGVEYHQVACDDYGIPLLRDNCKTIYYDSAGVLRDAGEWSSRCVEILRLHQPPHKVVTQVYILSWPAEDAEKLPLDLLIGIGVCVAQEFLAGHETLVSAHKDKDHPHIHLTVLSYRTLDREPRDWMLTNEAGEVIRSEISRGYAHHHTAKFENALYDFCLNLSRKYGLNDSDFRITMKHNRDMRIAECTKTLKAALGQIIEENPYGLPYEVLVEELETRCSTQLSKDKDGYRVKFGSRGKVYPLESYGIQDKAIDITVGDLFAEPTAELSPHQKRLRDELLTCAHGAATIRDLRERLRMRHSMDLLGIDGKLYLRPCWEDDPVPVDSLGVSSRDLSRYMMTTRQGQMELLREVGAGLDASESVCDEIYRRVSALRDDPKALQAAYWDCLRLARDEMYEIRDAARDALWEEHRAAMERIYDDYRRVLNMTYLPVRGVATVVGGMLPHMLMVSPMVAVAAIAIMLGLAMVAGWVSGSAEGRLKERIINERAEHAAYRAAIDLVADLGPNRGDLIRNLETARRMGELFASAAEMQDARGGAWPEPLPLRQAMRDEGVLWEAGINPGLARER